MSVWAKGLRGENQEHATENEAQVISDMFRSSIPLAYFAQVIFSIGFIELFHDIFVFRDRADLSLATLENLS